MIVLVIALVDGVVHHGECRVHHGVHHGIMGESMSTIEYTVEYYLHEGDVEGESVV